MTSFELDSKCGRDTAVVERNVERFLFLSTFLTAVVAVAFLGLFFKEAFVPFLFVGSLNALFKLYMLPWIFAWLAISFKALIIAFPFALFSALYISEIAPERLSKVFRFLFRLFEATPTVIVAGIGVALVAVRGRVGAGPTLAGVIAVLLAVSVYPALVCYLLDRFTVVPKSFKMASYALGASRWQTIKSTILPLVSPGAAAAALMGFRRILGEIIVALVVIQTADSRFLQEGISQMVPLSMVFGSESAVSGTILYHDVFILGFLMLLLSYLLNHFAQRLIRAQGGE